MKIFNWMHSKLNGRQGSKKPSGFSVNHQVLQEPAKEEFSDWPQGLLAIGTFGNNNLTEESESRNIQEDNPSSSQELTDFTPEEVGELQKELTKLLSRKPVSNGAESTRGEIANLPLDRFLNCPSSLEVDRTNCTRFCDDSNDKDHELQHSTSVVLNRGKDISVDSNNANAIRKRSLSFLLKKMFVCSSGFAPAPSLREPLPETRMEKILRKIIHNKMYTQSSTLRSTKKYLDNRPMQKAGKEDELQDKANDGSKWVKTDSEYIVLEI